MSTTTQILFNSPALHSLKRDQLVKLCKIHSIKANGKNIEIIQRLRQHAQTMPKDSPLSIAARSEPSGPIPIEPMEAADPDSEELQREPASEEEMEDIAYRNTRARPSEQWEMVMDSIEEVEENSPQGTLSSQRTVNGIAGEFGTGSSKSTTVSSSIKALANSLGLKRTMTKSTPASTSSSKASTSSVPMPQDDLTQNSTPYASLPPASTLPETDHFTLDPRRSSLSGTTEAESPLPGHSLKPGVPAPPNARLSLGLGLGLPATPTRQQPTTTIRLVSNPLAEQAQGRSIDLSYGAGENGTPQLKPFKTTFDITFGSPVPSAGFGFGFGFGSLSSWPPKSGEDVDMAGIYPKLTFGDLPPSVAVTPAKLDSNQEDNEDEDVHMPGSLSPARNAIMEPTTPPKAAASTPFVFGSPLPQHNVTNNQFKAAAASVLEEMNARLRAEGVEEIALDIVKKLHPNKHVSSPSSRAIKPIPASKRGEISGQFEKAHQEVFEKMEGIDGTLKRRIEREKASPAKKIKEDGAKEKVIVGKKRKSSVLGEPTSRLGGPRRPSVLPKRPSASTTRVISNGRRAKAIPGAFGMDEEDDDDAAAEDAGGGKRARIDPDGAPDALPSEQEAKRAVEVERRALEAEKEKEAIKRKLEANRARRRSSAAHGGAGGRKSIGAGRKSIGRNGPRPSVLLKSKPKPSRFGFLSSAKSLVQSVWNRGKAPATDAPSGIPKPTTTTITNAKPPQLAPAAKGKEKMGPPSIVPAKKTSLAPAKPTSATANGSGGRVPSVRISNAKQTAAAAPTTSQAHAQGSIASSSRSRSPLPSFGTMSSLASSSSSSSSNTGLGSGRNSMQSNASRLSSLAGTGKSRGSTTNGVSSVGTRMSSARTSATGTGASGVGSMGLRKAAAGGASRTSTVGTAASGSSSTRSSSRLSTTSSRLLAPTASSLAKAARRSSPTGPAGSAELKPVSESNDKSANSKQALGMITNSPAVNNGGTPSQRPGGIFSKPLLLPAQSGIPTPVKKRSTEAMSVGAEATEDGNSTTTTTTTKPRSLSGRKPRISRSKVIARLASQRAASGSSSTSSRKSGGLKPRGSGVGGKTRSSLGAKVSRASYGGGAAGALKGRASGASVLSAKRRARQSEYLRRRSRGVSGGVEMVGGDKEVGDSSTSMDVDSSL